MKLSSLAAAFAALCLGLSLSAKTLTPQEKASEFQGLANTIRSQYGPYTYKQGHLKLDLDKLVADYSREAATGTNLAFYYLINRFVAEFQDSHFGSRLNTTHESTLGIVPELVDGKLYVDSINHRLVPFTAGIRIGDEIVSLDGTPAQDVITDLARFVPAGYSGTARRLAAYLVTHRPSTLVPAPTGGTAKLVLRRPATPEPKVFDVELSWHEQGEPLLDDDRRETEPEWAAGGASFRPDYLSLSIEDVYRDIPRTERSFRCSGGTRIAIPEGARILLPRPFVAYVHPTPKGNIGYLRIPHYSWTNPVTGADESDLRFQQYEWVIDQLEKDTVGLVIDQDHNCGGSVFFLERMVSLFAHKPFHGLNFQFLATRNEYLTFKAWSGGEAATTLAGAGLTEVLETIRTAWMLGKPLSEKTSFRGSQLIAPNSVRYTKPIVMLIDELSGSGGDAFPGMLQGLGRAKLLGTRTMGAGGHVVAIPPLGYSANQLRITKSLFYHPNGTAIENNGVTPDVPYTITRKDFLDGYRDYQKTYLKELAALIP